VIAVRINWAAVVSWASTLQWRLSVRRHAGWSTGMAGDRAAGEVGVEADAEARADQLLDRRGLVALAHDPRCHTGVGEQPVEQTTLPVAPSRDDERLVDEILDSHRRTACQRVVERCHHEDGFVEQDGRLQARARHGLG
jgi:hypothetical protein